MILAYNFLLTLLAIFFLPLLVLVVLSQKKYRGRTLERLGLATAQIRPLHKAHKRKKTIWIHALSVGEVTSALPLVRVMSREMTSVSLVFTVATRSGRQVAKQLIAPYVDTIRFSPFDFWFSVKKYITTIQPDLFILVETDFWPNWLWQLKKSNIPAMLVNGRISQKSFASYKRFRFFFLPMFRCFTLFSMQTAKDSDKMIELGIAPDKILTLGNLKYDMDITHNTESQLERFTLDIDAQPAIFICGSTHRGEEKIIFSAFAQLLKEHNLFLILAPRDISRGKELVQLAGLFGLKARTRSSRSTGGNVLILDTIGELASCYRLAQLAFVGGSLVDRGGHNPIEPAAFGVPVLFGRHMEDFSEIADELVEKGGARMVTEPTLTQIASEILTSNTVHLSMAEKALSLVRKHRGCMANHIQVIRQLLGD